MKAIISILFLALSFNALAKNSDLELIGKAMAEFSIFKIDIYEVSYLKNKDGREELVLDYKRDIEKKYSIMGWEEGLKHMIKDTPENKPKYEWITNQTVDLAKDDKFTIRREGDKVTMLKNGRKIASTEDKMIARMAFEPWIGKKPIDKKIKNKLLGKD